MIKILDSSFDRLGIIKNVIEATRLEEINGENILDFVVILDLKMSNLITEDSIFELGGQYFDIKYLRKSVEKDNTYLIEVQSEHISYRLNDPDYNVEYFTENGTPTYILGKVLEGTSFTVDTVDLTEVTTYSAQEPKSRRQLLMEVAAYVEGELIFDNFEISLVAHRGSTTPQPAIKDRNISVISKTINKRDLDEEENPKVSYVCTPITVPGISYGLGDDIQLIQKTLGISEILRVIRIEQDPYNEINTKYEFANYTNDLASSLYNIMTFAVQKDLTYNGIRIGPQYGFEAVRNDKKARAYFRSDAMVFQSGDGTGENWTDRLYFEYDTEAGETTLVLDGKLSVNELSEITSDMGILLTGVIRTAASGQRIEIVADPYSGEPGISAYDDEDTIRTAFGPGGIDITSGDSTDGDVASEQKLSFHATGSEMEGSMFMLRGEYTLTRTSP